MNGNNEQQHCSTSMGAALSLCRRISNDSVLAVEPNVANLAVGPNIASPGASNNNGHIQHESVPSHVNNKDTNDGFDSVQLWATDGRAVEPNAASLAASDNGGNGGVDHESIRDGNNTATITKTNDFVGLTDTCWRMWEVENPTMDFYRAIEQDHVNTVEELLRHYPYLKEPKRSSTLCPLQFASFHNTSLPLVMSQELQDSVDSNSETALLLACRHSDKPVVVEYLLKECDASLSVESDQGLLPLHYACKDKKLPLSLVRRIWKEYAPSVMHLSSTYEPPLVSLIARQVTIGVWEHGYHSLVVEMLEFWPVATCIAC